MNRTENLYTFISNLYFYLYFCQGRERTPFPRPRRINSSTLWMWFVCWRQAWCRLVVLSLSPSKYPHTLQFLFVLQAHKHLISLHYTWWKSYEVKKVQEILELFVNDACWMVIAWTKAPCIRPHWLTSHSVSAYSEFPLDGSMKPSRNENKRQSNGI